MRGLALWDLVRGRRAPSRRTSAKAQPRKQTAQQQRYDALVADMKSTWRIRIHKWRTSTSGCAWELRDRQGEVTRMIEAPYPRGPVSCAVFLHEVGHHAIGFAHQRLRCMEEHLAWEWAIREMRQRGFHVSKRVLERRRLAMQYALRKALRRGLKAVPEPLLQWLPEHQPMTLADHPNANG